MNGDLYYYRAHIDSVCDGDTCTATVDLGMNIKQSKIKVRLYGINAPEIRGETREDGLKSRDYLRSLILGKDVEIKTYRDKRGEYGRYLGEIWIEDHECRQLVNDLLVLNGYAVKKNIRYGKEI